MAFLSSGMNLQHALAISLLIARLGDVGSTYLATPNLKLESNPIVRGMGWKFALLTLLLFLVPYYSAPLGLTVLVASLLVTASNLSKGWVMRSLGEELYSEFMALAAARSSRPVALAFVLGSAAFFAFAGALLVFFSGGPTAWAYWFAQGMLIYSLAVAVYGSLSVLRLFKQAGLSNAEAG